jgi:rod shape-determining protein MreB
LLIGEATAERVKIEIGIARAPLDGKGLTARLSGRDVARGVPAETMLNQQEMAEAISEPVSRIMHVVRVALEHTQPEIAADVIEEGITMTGGGSLLRHIDLVMSDETGLKVRIAENPLDCVALGAGRALEDAAYRGALNSI